jgi:hypothetical protein
MFADDTMLYKSGKNIVNIEIPAFEFKLTTNKSYGVGTVGDRLGAGVKIDRG